MGAEWEAAESISFSKYGDTEGSAQGVLVREVDRLYALMAELRRRFYDAEGFPSSPVANQVTVQDWNGTPVAYHWDADAEEWSEIGGQLPGKAIPLGSIILWCGSTAEVPDHFALCNGQTVGAYKTPDLRNRFVLGAGSGYAIDAVGGAATHSLTLSELPAHTHSLTEYAPTWTPTNELTPGPDGVRTELTSASATSTQRTTSSAGSGTAHNNLPPYRALCFIMRVS